MTSNRKQDRRMLTWRRYQDRIDRLVRHQRQRSGAHPARVTSGYFRAEGWNTDDARSPMRHGA
jgi:hypothetical protein